MRYVLVVCSEKGRRIIPNGSVVDSRVDKVISRRGRDVDVLHVHGHRREGFVVEWATLVAVLDLASARTTSFFGEEKNENVIINNPNRF